MQGTCDERVFDERELKFEIGDGESFNLPAGVEKAIMAMEQGEEALFTIKPKYVHMCKLLLFHCSDILYKVSQLLDRIAFSVSLNNHLQNIATV